MPERSRDYLKQEFRDGERPSGADFSDLMDSFMNKVDDGMSLDGNNNLQIPNGLTLKDSAVGTAGTLRFNGGQVQFNNGTTWNNLASGSTGAFTPVGGGPHVAFNDGNVGIGTAATPPTFRLEVVLGANTAADQRVRFGNAVLSNGQGASAAYAQFSNQSQSAGNDNFALRQGTAGDVNLNAPVNQPITISHGRTTARLFVAPTGQVVVGSNALLAQSDNDDVFQVNGDAFKNGGNNLWDVPSDLRLKQDVKPFEEGLSKLLQVRPVRFRFNGQLNTNPNREEVGIIGQEMEKIFPYMVSRGKTAENKADATPDDVLIYNGSALTYVMVNAIRELSDRIVELEKQLAAQKNQAQA